MNKQEVIKAIEAKFQNSFSNEYQSGEEAGLTYALELVEQLDAPEKVVLSKEEAEWLERLKKAKSFLNCLYIITRQGWGHDFEFYVHEEKYKLSYRDDNDEDSGQTKNRLVNAILYGYEVEKEKLYTVRLKATGEFIYFKKLFQCYNSGTSVKPVAHDNKEYHHAENVLKELLFWDNPAFEIKEVKKEEE